MSVLDIAMDLFAMEEGIKELQVKARERRTDLIRRCAEDGLIEFITINRRRLMLEIQHREGNYALKAAKTLR